MKYVLKMTGLAAIALAATSAPAQAGGGISFGFNYASPPPVYYAPQPYYYPQPVYYAPPPVYYAPQPYYYPPAYSSFSLGYGNRWGGHHRRHYRGGWGHYY